VVFIYFLCPVRSRSRPPPPASRENTLAPELDFAADDFCFGSLNDGNDGDAVTRKLTKRSSGINLAPTGAGSG
jgi:hypothetical protein